MPTVMGGQLLLGTKKGDGELQAKNIKETVGYTVRLFSP